MSPAAPIHDPALAQSEKAYLLVKDPSAKIPLDFNPVTLQVTVQARGKDAGGNKKQHVSSTTAKLDVELVFDSTDTGQDVRKRTRPLEQLLAPAKDQAPPQVTFEWGSFAFSGVVESFKQTLDFFSRNGVPLRAAVGISISAQDYVFESKEVAAQVDATLDVPGGNPTSLAASGGDPGAARKIAAANGLESLRAEAGGGLSVGGGVSIGAAASFSPSAGAGFGFGVEAGVGVGVGAQVGGSGSLALGGGAAAGAGAGFSAEGGVAAGFAGLRIDTRGASGAGQAFDTSRIFASVSAPSVSAGASFDVSGRAISGGGSSFKADVTGGVRFDGA
jgi:hypothetical protein